ncbi:YqhA family protein [Methylophaga sp. OBS4]|uniref:YqhA family protein n=1 Tax=Methylophaga sp. OBS4 TaxID=2991935 RepID=UPI00224D6B85|nr:YqhA family protein [Methylophaga sp. OBS4]MCX4187849.1 YqhA family protein [Methylophaga sp. OBS4]
MERMFEKMLWNSRFVVLIAVIASLMTALAMFYMATVDVYYLVTHLGHYLSPDLIGEARQIFRAETITHVVEVIDGYLLATVLFIFSLGLYELFISKIEEAENSDNLNVLAIHSLDDLKARLGRVVLMILIVNFFEHAISMDFHGALDLLALAGGIGLIALALYFSHPDDH